MMLSLLTIGLMIVVNAIFAAYEMALATITRARILILVNLKKDGAAETLFMKEKMEGSLAVVQLGITLAGAIAAAAGGAGVDEFLSPWLKSQWPLSDFWADVISLCCLIIPLTCLTIVFAELIPKTYAISHHEQVCLTLSKTMKVLAFWAYPLVIVLEKIVKKAMLVANRHKATTSLATDDRGLHELNAAVAMARTSRLVGANQEKILLAAAQLSSRTVKEILIPASEISMIYMGYSLSQALIRAHNDMHTRFPVSLTEGDAQSIEGYVNFKDIIATLKLNPEDPSIRGIVRVIKRFHEGTVLSQALEEMISQKLHIALVTSSQGTVIGLITLEDIIEELVGEIEDEFDRIPAYIHPYGDVGWLVGTGLTMEAFCQSSGVALSLSAEELKMRMVDWLGQYIKKPLLGGESLNIKGLQVVARKLRRNKLAEVAITRNEGQQNK